MSSSKKRSRQKLEDEDGIKSEPCSFPLEDSQTKLKNAYESYRLKTEISYQDFLKNLHEFGHLFQHLKQLDNQIPKTIDYQRENHFTSPQNSPKKQEKNRNFKNASVSTLNLPNIDGPAGILVVPYSNELIWVDRLGKELKSWSQKEGDQISTLQTTKMTEVQEIAVSNDGNYIYLIDSGKNSKPALHRFDLVNKSFETLTNEEQNKQFSNPRGIALSGNGKILYIANTDDQTILTFDLKTKQISTLCGKSGEKGQKDGNLEEARLYFPDCIAVSDDGQTLYISEVGTVREIQLSNNQREINKITTIYKGLRSGRGISFLGTWNESTRIGVVDYLANSVFILKQSKQQKDSTETTTIWEMELRIGNDNSTKLNDGIQSKATFNNPVAMFFDRKNEIMFVSDESNNLLRKITFNKN